MKKTIYTKMLAVAIAAATTIGTVGATAYVPVNVMADAVAQETTVNQTTAITGKIGNEVKYSYDTVKKELTISGKGEMWDGAKIKGVLDAEKIVIEEGITSVGGENFIDFQNKLDVTLPSTLTTINEKAFNQVKKIAFTKNIKKVCTNAFNSIEIAEFMGDVVGFDYESIAVKKVILHGAAQELAKATGGVIDGVVIAEDNEKVQIKDLLVLSRDGKTLYCSTNYTRMGDDIEKVTIPDTVETIVPYALTGSRISYLILGGNVENIGESAFESSVIKKITVNKKLKTIESYAFNNTRLKKIKINKNTVVKPAAFDSNVVIEHNTKFKKMQAPIYSATLKKNTINVVFNKLAGVKNYEVTVKKGKTVEKYTTTKNSISKKLSAKLKKGNKKITVTVRGYKLVNKKKVFTKASIPVTVENME
ncbi:MAG: leucine-rich repeat domain-containing protein [Lachnospiraceae bacterium]|nr:leucine-rich repeat domain-containing protein [Lachnospiraceae bacterium]